MPEIILATTSPYRIKAFKFLGIDFEAKASDIDESQTERNNPEELVKMLSKLKAEAVAKDYPDAIVIGMDSIGCFDGRILEKPKSKEEQTERLKLISGNKIDFLTGIFMVNTASGKTLSDVAKTEAYMRNLSEEEIKRYLDEDPSYNTYCLGFDPLSHSSSSFIKKIEGSYNNILRGIPIEAMPEMLASIR